MNIPPIIVLSGPKFSGKSRFVERLIARLGNNGLAVGGFFQRGVFNESGEKVGYDLVGAIDGSCTPIARLGDKDDCWSFFDDAFMRASEMLPEHMDVCVMDEIGPLEIAGKGHARTLERAIENQCALLVVVREELASGARGLFPAEREVVKINYFPGDEHMISEQIVRVVKDKGG